MRLCKHGKSALLLYSTTSDHSAITLALNGIDDSRRGPSFWKFNSTLANDIQANYDELYGYITQWAIIRSRAAWYEKGEKNNKYFFNFEKSNKKKSCVRKIFTSDETLTSNPKTILSELELFYSNLYKTKNDDESERKLSSLLDDLSGVPMLSEELRSICGGGGGGE